MRVEFNRQLFDVSIPAPLEIVHVSSTASCLLVEADTKKVGWTLHPALIRCYRLTDGKLLYSIFNSSSSSKDENEEGT